MCLLLGVSIKWSVYCNTFVAILGWGYIQTLVVVFLLLFFNLFLLLVLLPPGLWLPLLYLPGHHLHREPLLILPASRHGADLQSGFRWTSPSRESSGGGKQRETPFSAGAPGESHPQRVLFQSKINSWTKRQVATFYFIPFIGRKNQTAIEENCK